MNQITPIATFPPGSNPGWLEGYVPPAAEWNFWWSQKMDINGGNYLPLSGGRMTGPITFQVPPVTTSPASGSGYIIEQDITYNLPNTASGIYFGNEFNAVVSGNPSGGVQVWNNFDRLFAETASTSQAALVNRYIQTIRPAGFGAPGQVMWGAVVELRDQTGLPSSGAGGLLGLEIDIACNGADDAGSRQGLVITFLNGTGTGASPQADKAIGIFSGGDAAANFKSIIQMAVPFHDAGIDMRNTGTSSGGTSHGIWMRSGLDIALDTTGNFNFSSDGTFINASQRINSPFGYAIGGNGATITADGVTINFSLPVNSGHGFSFGGAGSPVLLTGDGSTVDVSVPFRVPPYAVGALPSLIAAERGSLAFATNARNSAEGAGSGSGCLVCLNSTGTWVAVWSGLPPTT